MTETASDVAEVPGADLLSNWIGNGREKDEPACWVA
jgi:hypothetical protein